MINGMMVYWIELHDGVTPQACFEWFEDGEDQIGQMLARCAELREAGKMYVTSCSHHSTGVAGVIDGKLPDGSVYQWRKRRPY
jgi:hypothetical protein